jgi:hypothetical protein
MPQRNTKKVQLLAMIIAQLFTFMLGSHIPHGYMTSGTAIVFTYLNDSDHDTHYYHRAEPKNGDAGADSFKPHPTPVRLCWVCQGIVGQNNI